MLATLALTASFMNITALAQSGRSGNSLDIPRLEQEIGQMLMVGIRGAAMNAEGMEQTQHQIRNGEIGGIIFFKHNIKNRIQLGTFVGGIVSIPVNLPLLLAVDEEGGKVRRLRKSQGFEESPSAEYVGTNLNISEAYDVYSRMANQIHNTGLNLNLAPVIDVNINQTSPAIGELKRSYSGNPETVYEYSAAFIKAHHTAGVVTTLKHYPGHGSSKEDTHNDLTDITKTWKRAEQIPFKRLIDSSQVDLIMAGHLVNRNVDSKYPASLSQAHIQQTLRDKLGFEGIVITDDLQMGAIIKRFDLEEITIAAINAGCDILQFSDPLDLDENLPIRIRSIVIAAIKDGKIDPNRIHESYNRIVELKHRLNKSSN